jgi:hypothetical protein
MNRTRLSRVYQIRTAEQAEDDKQEETMKTMVAAGVAGLMLVAAAMPAAADADRDVHVAGKIMKEFFVKPFLKGFVEPTLPPAPPPPPVVKYWSPDAVYVAPPCGKYVAPPYYYSKGYDGPVYVKPYPPQYVRPYWQHDPDYRRHGDRGYAPRYDLKRDFKGDPRGTPRYDKGPDRDSGRAGGSRYNLHK